MASRHHAVVEAMGTSGLSGLVVMPGANLQYLLGVTLHPSKRLTVAFFGADETVRMVVPALEHGRVKAMASLATTFYPWHDNEGYGDALQRCLADANLTGRIGVEYTAMRVLELRAIEERASVTVEDATALLADLRMVKDADEIEAMRRAVRVIEDALAVAVKAMRPGATEREIAMIWDQAIGAAGSEPSFETSVASGPNSANPHHTPGDRVLQRGDLVILDGGARIDGYCSDITRTFAIGELDEQKRTIYDAVLRANRAGFAVVRPGASGADVDAAAREVIESSGYGPQFLHRTGHGLGIEIHEPPYMHSGEPAPLREGVTFTIEPGIYVAGVGGVRIEDDVVITADGGECLTSYPRELQFLPA